MFRKLGKLYALRRKEDGKVWHFADSWGVEHLETFHSKYEVNKGEELVEVEIRVKKKKV